MKCKWIFLFALLFLSAESALAEKYISDVLWVSLRESADDAANSVKVLRTGTELTVIGEEEIDGYVKVKTRDGLEGWISSRYLLDEPTAAQQLKQLEKQNEALQQENQSLKQELAEFKKDGRETDKERKRMLSENKKLVQENQRLQKLAANPAKFAEENEQLKAANAKLDAEYKALEAQVETSEYEVERTWFITGAGVLFAGIILGIIIPNLRFRRRGTFS